MKAKFNFTEALNHAGLEFVGQQHSGIADSRMTAVLAVKLHKDGANFRITRDLNQHELNRSF